MINTINYIYSKLIYIAILLLVVGISLLIEARSRTVETVKERRDKKKRENVSYGLMGGACLLILYVVIINRHVIKNTWNLYMLKSQLNKNNKIIREQDQWKREQHRYDSMAPTQRWIRPNGELPRGSDEADAYIPSSETSMEEISRILKDSMRRTYIDRSPMYTEYPYDD